MTKELEETLEVDGYVHYLDRGGVYIHQNLSNYTLETCILLCDNYISKMLLKIRIVEQE